MIQFHSYYYVTVENDFWKFAEKNLKFHFLKYGKQIAPCNIEKLKKPENETGNHAWKVCGTKGRVAQMSQKR